MLDGCQMLSHFHLIYKVEVVSVTVFDELAVLVVAQHRVLLSHGHENVSADCVPPVCDPMFRFALSAPASCRITCMSAISGGEDFYSMHPLESQGVRGSLI